MMVEIPKPRTRIHNGVEQNRFAQSVIVEIPNIGVEHAD